nr:DUF5050 domain-containing protein [uncultured Acetatifactor sp.]
MKEYITFMREAAVTTLLSGCGGAADGEPHGEGAISEPELSAEEGSAVEEMPEEQAAEAEITEPEMPEEEVPKIEADTTVYGNTAGNIMSGGLFLEDDDYFYLYHGYDNCVYRTDRKTGVSDKLVDGYCLQLNMVDGKIYANMAQDESIVEIEPESGQVTEIRKGAVEYLMSADRELYFTDASDSSLRKFSLDSMEETVLVDRPIVTPCIYKDRVYFALDSDGHYLYSVPREGEALTQVNEVHSYMPVIYKDRIYYLGMEDEAYSIRCMGLNGSGESIIADTDAAFMNLFGSRLYYADGADSSKVYFLDLETENPVPESVRLEAQIEEALNRYALEPVSEYRLDGYMGLNFQQEHMAFMCLETMDGEQYMDECIYEEDTDRILPVAYFIVDGKVAEAAMEEAAREEMPETAVSAQGDAAQTVPAPPVTENAPDAAAEAPVAAPADIPEEILAEIPADASVEIIVEEPTAGDRYTPEEAIAIYRSLMEAGGMTWNPSLKGNWDETIGLYPIEDWYLHMDNYNGTSWGTGFIYLDKGMPEWAAGTDLESCAIGDGVGNPWTSYYIEVTGADAECVYIVMWSA